VKPLSIAISRLIAKLKSNYSPRLGAGTIEEGSKGRDEHPLWSRTGLMLRARNAWYISFAVNRLTRLHVGSLDIAQPLSLDTSNAGK